MEENKIKNRMAVYNGLVKENDDLYRGISKVFGLADCAFWILYSLRTEDEALTQRDICDFMCQPKQTVNSALKKMETDGYIALQNTDDHRKKLVCLTEKGVALAEQTVDRVIAIELEALGGMTIAEQEAFLNLFRKYTELLKLNMHQLETSEKNLKGREHDDTII